MKDGLKESLKSLLFGCLSELWKLIRGEFPKETELISSWTDYFFKGAKICKSITEIENLTDLLADNGALSLEGELNNEEILNESEMEKYGKQKIKLKLGTDVIIILILLKC